MSEITTRADKDVPLTIEEMDNNFIVLNLEKAEKTQNLADLADLGEAKINLGLGNVDNTADADKPVSTLQAEAMETLAQAAAEDATTKANARQAPLVSGENIKTINGESILGEGNIVIVGGGGGSGLVLKDAVAEVALLPLIDNELGDAWLVGTDPVMIYAWNGTEWLNSGQVGLKGDQGDQGIQGIPGEVGPQGIQGEAGPQGLKGDTGDAGADGTSVKLKGAVPTIGDLPAGAAEGDLYVVSSTGDGHVWDGAVWVNVGAIQGPKGDTGEAGPQGIQGEVGPQGIQGVQGLQGPQGVPGVDGSDGADGTSVKLKGSVATVGDLPAGAAEGDLYVVVATGDGHVWGGAEWANVGPIRGPKGDTGDVGPQGEIGLQGAQGDVGPQGIQGLQGIQGIQGVKGDTGDTGLQGIQGPQGVKGDTGDAGPQGLQGIQGPKGDTGDTGLQGIQGLPGVDGTDGTDGVGVPAGGDTGQMPVKASATDHDFTWETPVRANTPQNFTAPQRSALLTDNDGSFDLAAKQNFKCTTAGAVTLTFTNQADGLSGSVIFINGGNHAIAAHANTKITTADLTRIQASGTYRIDYLSDGTNAHCSVVGPY